MNLGAIPPAGMPPGSPNQPPHKPSISREAKDAGDSTGSRNSGPNEPNGDRASHPSMEPGPETRALIAEFRQADAEVIVERILRDRRALFAVMFLKKDMQETIAQTLSRRLPEIGALAQELSQDPLILSFIAMLSVDICKQILQQLGLPEEETPLEEGNIVEPPEPPPDASSLDTLA